MLKACPKLLLYLLLDFAPSLVVTSLHFILSYKARFCKQTVLKVHPPICWITARSTMSPAISLDKGYSPMCISFEIIISSLSNVLYLVKVNQGQETTVDAA